MSPIHKTMIAVATLAGLSIAGCAACKCGGRNAPSPATAPSAKANHQPVIVRLVDHDHVVTITASGHGPRYSVATQAGQSLAANLTLDELRERHPALYRRVHPDAVADVTDATDRAQPASGVGGLPWAGLDASAE